MTQPQSWQVSLGKGAPALLKDANISQNSILADGALSMKVKTLMTMVCDAILAHPDGVAAIAGRAREMGASEEEIAEAAGVAYLMGGLPALVFAANAFRD